MSEPIFRRALLTNDDGIDAPGLAALEAIGAELAEECWVIAPHDDRTGASHAITLDRPLRAEPRGERRWALNGAPADCVMIALNHFLAEVGPPDVVLSGVNFGANLAEDTHCSGTVGAAMEAVVAGVPAFALSQRMEDRTKNLIDWSAARAHGADAIRAIWRVGLPKDVVANLNFPPCPAAEVRGLTAAPIARRKQGDHVVERFDPRNLSYFWIGQMRLGPAEPGTDVALTADRWITATPLRLNWADETTLTRWRVTLD